MIKKLLHSNNSRTKLAKKNIALSLLLKIVGMTTMFLLVPLSIKYLGNTNYGVWVTVSGIIAWAGMFDFGFSHGLRNRLTESLAKKDYRTGRFLVSSTYLFMLIVAVLLAIIFYPMIYLINWQILLNLPTDFNLNILRLTLQIIFFFFIIQFSLKPLNAILQAYQYPSIAQSLGTIGGIFTILAVGFLDFFQYSPQLIYYAIAIAGTPIVISLLATIFLFRKKFQSLLPSFKYAKINHIRAIGGLGLTFFIIQLSLLVVYSSDNLIISYLFGPEEVTTYSVVYRYFSIITIFFGVIMSPYWSAITDAYTKGEMQWIQNTIRTLLLILLGGGIIALFMFLISPWVFKMWIGKNFIASPMLVGLMAIYAVSMAWLNIFSFFSNGIGKIRVQMITYIIAATVNLPFSYFFGKILHMGSKGVLLATIISMLIVNIVLTIQYKMIINTTAKGVWSK